MSRFTWLFALVALMAGCDKALSNQCLETCGTRGVARFMGPGYQVAMVCECGPPVCGLPKVAPAEDGGAK